MDLNQSIPPFRLTILLREHQEHTDTVELELD